tara:strand:- start:1130 stop:2197 length:1068 start_codon:yes stop_codon:yes gene_type:complete
MCILEGCNSKEKYGEYCYKHRRNYLIDSNSHPSKAIIIDRWTNKCSDYLKQDIIDNLCDSWYFWTDKGISDSGIILAEKSKKELFLLLTNKINFLKNYSEKDIQRIIQIQTKIKNKGNNKIDNLRGEGFLNKSLSNNDTDFFTYDSRDEIDDKYYFSYKDEKGFVWFFDIRSFNKLVELNQPNPYTMLPIPKKVIKRAKDINKLLKLNQSDELVDFKQLQLSRRQIVKQKTIDLFCDIDTSGYYCQPEWFLSLNLHLLKKLYRNLEDLWNYRLQITPEVKSRICPPNGLVFTTRVSDVNSYTNKDNLRDLLLNDILKFQNAVSFEDKKLGYMYFIIGLGTVSRPCCETHQWLMYV